LHERIPTATFPTNQTKATAAGSSSPRNRDLKSERYCLSLLIRKVVSLPARDNASYLVFARAQNLHKKILPIEPATFSQPLALIATAVPHAAEGAVGVVGGAKNVRVPRLPPEKPPPTRACVSAETKTNAVAIAPRINQRLRNMGIFLPAYRHLK